MWACLALMAMEAAELNTAEVAFAAIGEVDRLQFVLHVKDIPTEEGRSAELALYKRRPLEAEAILLQAGLIYRAIKLHIKLFNWERALQLALDQKAHLHTVLWYRRRHLASIGQQETSPLFLQHEAVELPSDKEIREVVEAEKAKEAARPGARPY
eukprot:evm.model.scf_932.3 EVM.evm.TU.scf_932.3   scf_932:41511-43103(+)